MTHISTHLPDAPLSLKKVWDGEFGYLGQDETHYSSPGMWLWIGIMGGCGCGNGDEIAKDARRVLDLFATPHEQRTWNVYDNRADEILAHWLDHADLIEHGSNIAQSWLNKRGLQVKAALDALDA